MLQGRRNRGYRSNIFWKNVPFEKTMDLKTCSTGFSDFPTALFFKYVRKCIVLAAKNFLPPLKQYSEEFFQSTFSHENISKALCKADLNNKLWYFFLFTIREKSHISQMLQTASSLLYHFSHYSLWPDFQICSKPLKQFCLLKY